MAYVYNRGNVSLVDDKQSLKYQPKLYSTHSRKHTRKQENFS